MRGISTSKYSAVAVAAAGMLAVAGTAHGAVIADFNSGIGAVANHPYPTSASNTWYDATSDAFATPSASTLDGSGALKIADGGFTNGVYIIYSGVVPTTGEYTLQAKMDVVEDPAAFNAIQAYEMGVIVNGVHRTDATTPNDVATVNPADPGSGVANFAGLTAGDDNALAPQTIITDSFRATAGDNLLIVFSTDTDTGNFDNGSGNWGTAGLNFVLVDNIELVPVPEPATAGLLLLGGGALALRRRRQA